MSDVKIYGERLRGVGCGVTGCKYNGCHQGAGNTCCASHIHVQNESAVRKAETFCSTFEPKSNMR